jgi:WD40 repeat protein
MVRIGLCVLMGMPVLGAVLLAVELARPEAQALPDDARARQEALAVLRQRAADSKADTTELWRLWLEFRRHAGTSEYVQAAETMSRVPSPLDRFAHRFGPRWIPQEERPFVQSTEEVVAILGEHRARHWRSVSLVAISPDSKLLVSSGGYPGENRVGIWQADSMDGGGDLPIRDHFLTRALAIDHSGTLLATATDNKVDLWALSVDAWPRSRHLTTFEGHTEDVRSLVFAADGKTLVSSAFDYQPRIEDPSVVRAVKGEVIFWKAAGERGQSRHLRTLPRDPTPIDAEALSLDGSWLVDQPANRSAPCRLWRLKSDSLGKPALLKDARAPFAFTSDGKQLATANANGGLTLWDLTMDPPNAAWQMDPLPQVLNRGLAFSPDGSLLASVADDRQLHLWPLTGAAKERLEVQRVERHREFSLGEVGTCVAFWPDGKKVAVGTENGRVQVRELVTGRELFPPRGHRSRVSCVAVSPDCQGVASVGSEGVRFWDLSGGQVREAGLLKRQEMVPPGLALEHSLDVTGAEYAPDGKWLLLGLSGEEPFHNQVQVWDLGKGMPKKPRLFPSHTEWMRLLFSAKGDQLLTVGEDTNPNPQERVDKGDLPVVRLWMWGDGKLEMRQEVPPDLLPSISPLKHATLSPDGKLLALHFLGGIQLWDLGNKTPRSTAYIKNKGGWDHFGPLAFAADGKTLITTGIEGQGEPEGTFKGLVIRFWDVVAPTPVEYMTMADPGWRSVDRVAISLDGKLLAIGDNDGRLTVWRLKSGEKVWSHRFPGGCVFRFAPDSRHLITGNGNGTLYVLRLLPTPTR